MAHAAKALFRDSQNFEQFAQTFGIGRGNTFMFTLTFRDNMTDKIKASRRWNVLLTSIRKKFDLFRFICVWERQKRGSWHCHLLCNCPTATMKKFKQIVRDFIDCSGLSFGFIHARWTSGKDFKGVSLYLAKYLLKENREHGIRYVSYSQNWVRRVKGEFAFLGGKSQFWRRACLTLDAMFPITFRYFYDRADFFSKQLAVSSLGGDCVSFLRDNFMCCFFNSHSGISRRMRHMFNVQYAGYLVSARRFYQSVLSVSYVEGRG